ncbi:MAG: N-acetyl-gamma-glutamyl-phosphate reductase [Clostridia bacterium]|nr:N-acetyl-gamma-glutamyl-phosphate reductase [Clostridia bacterium]
MHMTRVYIDGSAGTTGLRIRERLAVRGDLDVLTLPDALRHDETARRDMMASADITFLCLPDDAAREAAAWADETDTVVIDTSTVHRTSEDWTYGFPELAGMREKISASKRIANPGCHATGFISLVAPLVQAGLIGKNEILSCFSLTGYSGGGKKMIAQYEQEDRDPLLDAPRAYGLGQTHKHLPEMKIISGIEKEPVFCPVVAPFYAGMEVIVPLMREQLKGSVNDAEEVYRSVYAKGLVRAVQGGDEGGFLSAGAFAGRDDLQVSVFGNEDRILLTARFDNLGKGASGAAIQNMNLVLGLDEATGLVTGE